MTPPPEEHCDLLIVGAGPAGMAAAVAAAPSGARIVLVDDNPAPGGQIWRSGPHAKPPPEAARLRAAMARCGNVHLRIGTRVAASSSGRMPAAGGCRPWMGRAPFEADPVHRRARAAAALPWLDAARRDRRGRPAGAHQGRLAGVRRAHRDRRQRSPAAGRRAVAPGCCASPNRHRSRGWPASVPGWVAGLARPCRPPCSTSRSTAPTAMCWR